MEFGGFFGDKRSNRLSVNEKFVNKVRPGTNVTFNVEEDLNTYSAKVYAVESRIDMKTRTLKVRSLYPNSNGRLVPGQSAVNIVITLNEIANALTIPNEAIIAEMGRNIAYLYSGGKAKQIEVIKGLRTESSVQIVQGLHAGDTLIVTGVMQLRDGMAVNIDNIIR